MVPRVPFQPLSFCDSVKPNAVLHFWYADVGVCVMTVFLLFYTDSTVYLLSKNLK